VAATSPATGGVSLAGAAWIGVGAAAGTAQCVASGVRVYNEMSEQHEDNAAMDANSTYRTGMAVADGIGLVSAAGGIKGVVQTAEAVRGHGMVRTATTWMGRPARKVLTESLGLTAAGKRASGRMINLVVKQRLLEGLGGGLGVAGSAY